MKKKLTPAISSALFLLLLCSTPVRLIAQELPAVSLPGSVEIAAGGTVTFPVTIKIPAGTYIYANPKGPGIGRETVITLKLPEGIKALKTSYPPGIKYTPAGFDDHVFIWKKSATIEVILYAESSAKNGTRNISINVSLLQCSDVCVPFDRDYKLALKVTGGVSAPARPAGNGNDFSIQHLSNAHALPGELSSVTPVYLEKKVTGILQAILLGIIAGFILNLMPCVLPVVSLKVMALLHHREHGDRMSARNHGLVFSSGILASFAILASLASFAGYSWGGLFQQSSFVTAMAVFVFAMSLSLFGVFTINIPGFAGRAAAKTGTGYADSFVKGMLATLLATPCSGPFLGGVLAWAMMQPAHAVFLIFISVGLGMALPYILIALVPSLGRFIPRPGAWMNTLEVVMGFLLVFTAVYLVSFLSRERAISALVIMVFVAIGLWQYGRFGAMDKTHRARYTSAAVLVAVIAAGIVISFYFFAPAVNEKNAEKFTIARIIENRNSGKITIINFTADWCPNCKLVEKTVLRSKTVLELLSRENIAFMTADVTRKNPDAETLMAKLGSKSIPFLAVFPPGEGFSSPICLRDLYSSDDVVRAVSIAEKSVKKQR